jgi:4'-phosphopantetheinyl transferase
VTVSIAPLQPDEVRVYYALSEHVAAPEDAELCRAMLSEEERQREQRFHFQADRQSYLAAHAVTRGVLGRLLGTRPSALGFVAGPRGRPELAYPASRPPLRFNLSHTRGMVACAVALEHDVGVDVELIERRVEIDHLARSVFSEDERADLARVDGEAQRQRFFELWTLKEAYIKAVGHGLGLPLRAITLSFEAGRAPRIRFSAPVEDDGARWSLDVRLAESLYMLAVAVRTSAPALTVRQLNPIWVK